MRRHHAMARHHLPRYLRALSLVGLAALASLDGCSSGILDVTNPDIIPTVNSASGALSLKNGVVLRLAQVTAGLGGNGPDNLFIYGGLLADEYRSGDTFVQRNDMDQRRWDPTNTFLAGPFRSLNRVRVGGTSAISALRTYAPTPTSNVGLMFGFIAFSENRAGDRQRRFGARESPRRRQCPGAAAGVDREGSSPVEPGAVCRGRRRRRAGVYHLPL